MSKQDSNKKKLEIIIDGVDTSVLSREKLESYILNLKEALDRERDETHYFQLERNKLSSFWEISRNRVDELQKQVFNHEREKEEEIERSQEIEKLQIQKIKYLKHEQTSDINAFKKESQATLLNAKAIHAVREAQLVKDNGDLQTKLREQEIASEDELRKVKLHAAEVLHKPRSEFEQKVREIIESGELNLQTELTRLGNRRRADLTDVVERKNGQLQELIHSHAKAFADLKSYYSDIALNNMGIINGLKKQMGDLQQAKERAEMGLKDAIADQRRLADPYEKAKKTLVGLKKKTTNADKDRVALAAKSFELTKMEQALFKLKWDFEILKQRYDKVAIDEEELKNRFTKAALELQQRAVLRGTIAKMCSEDIVS